ncbi:thioredoxin-disulfide reductase [Candidatus Woesearchaeota archaeon CG_4_10_14_0_2_um_filter_33_10]|nr:MAG: hypothetical protein AUJ83_01880 [Candidatus Woesearchaeota archaeon CG1_02_33_12]PIN77495.1 MAG: thioredoxin-disulfide reductase [Candidatus Woesearchaeota archaeon CG10_big_fil_rev_8_21_14_0_10_33_12]PIU72040.1 MAG: thioredoxin-disulfide reductase [Candidatus Woesearchaeota archaeon CG06_land_8_20_14_3_00_33_13]PIZ53477.1 MAG: thioredoxin-disulfide reductase [Candidatus Woesearchaeota archaeon CG_4_10_14_0_2_um_filter_33_10]
MYDLTIIGAGPAGITAAVYAARKKLNTLVITNNIGGWAATSSEVGNYPSYQFITGPELAKKFEEHLKSFELDLREREEAISIEKINNIFKVKTKKEEYESKTVIIANGRIPRELNIPGEKEFKNKGITYCATCDAPLFAGKDVAVIGGGNSALDAVIQLMKIAKKIYLINLTDKFICEEVRLDKARNSEKVEILENTETKEIIGDKFVSQMKVLKEGKEKILDVQGVFIEIGSVPTIIDVKTQDGNLKLNKGNEIIVDQYCKTNIPGLFAAGDVTDVPYKQIIIAAGQGSIATLSAFDYLSKIK